MGHHNELKMKTTLIDNNTDTKECSLKGKKSGQDMHAKSACFGNCNIRCFIKISRTGYQVYVTCESTELCMWFIVIPSAADANKSMPFLVPYLIPLLQLIFSQICAGRHFSEDTPNFWRSDNRRDTPQPTRHIQPPYF